MAERVNSWGAPPGRSAQSRGQERGGGCRAVRLRDRFL